MAQFKEITKQKEKESQTQINKLEEHVIEYDNLEQLSKDQKNNIDNLTTICQEKDDIIQSLEVVKLNLAKEKKDNVTLQKSIEVVKDKNKSLIVQLEEGFGREEKNKLYIDRIEGVNHNLKNTILEMEEMASKLNMELQDKRTDIVRYVTSCYPLCLTRINPSSHYYHSSILHFCSPYLPYLCTV
jgi:hypothetical protein